MSRQDATQRQKQATAWPDWAVQDLLRSGISIERAEQLGWRPVRPEEYPDLLGSNKPDLSDGYVIPFYDPATREAMQTPDGRAFTRVKLAHPADFGDAEQARYLSPTKGGQHAYIPPEVHQAITENRAKVILTEGEKKAVASTDAGLPMIGTVGVWGWIDSASKDLLPELKPYAGQGVEWTFVVDSDGRTNPEILKAMERLATVLSTHGTSLRYAEMPQEGEGKVGVDDFLQHHSVEDLRAHIQNEGRVLPPAHEWRELGTEPQYAPLPPFPWDAMPPVLRTMAQELVKTCQVRPEVAALVVLSVTGLAAGGRCRVRIKEGVTARPNIYVMVFVGPGERKSTLYRAALVPVQEWMSAHTDAWRDASDRIAVYEQRVKNLIKKASGSTTDPGQRQRYREELAAARRSAPEERNPHILVDDITAEAAVVRMAETGGLLGFFTDDGRQLLQILAGLYTQGVTRENVLVKAFDGDVPIRTDRRSFGSIEIQDPCAGLLVMVQPDWLRKLGKTTDLTDSGFLSRCVFCVPDPMAGRRDEDGKLLRPYSEYEMDPEIRTKYSEVITRLLNRSFEMTTTEPVQITPGARQLWISFYDNVEGALEDSGGFSSIKGMAPRFPALALRLAVIFALSEGRREISLADMKGAALLTVYFAHHTKRADQAMKGCVLPQTAQRVVDHLRRQGRSEFKASDIERSLGITAKEVGETLAYLTEQGYCRQLPVQERSGPGRPPSPRYQANPAIFGREGK